MAKFVITIQQVVDVEAKSEKVAISLIKSDPPESSFCGGGGATWYDVETRKSVKIISCVEKRSRKNA